MSVALKPHPLILHRNLATSGGEARRRRPRRALRPGLLAGDAECLDWLLIVGCGHLGQVLRVYVEHYNRHRPHRALQLEAPDRPARLTVVAEGQEGGVLRRDLLGGLLHEYRRAA